MTESIAIVKNCECRAENGNCLIIGGFCTSVPKEYCSMARRLQKYQALGTVEELKEILQIISEGQDDVDGSGISTGLLHTLLQYAEYAKLGTVEELREAREKQIAKKPNIKVQKEDLHIGRITFKAGTKTYWCPSCDNAITISNDYCPTCGQAIKVKRSEEE